MKRTLCKFKNIKNNEIKELWLTKHEYENLSFEFEQKRKQIL